MVFLHRVTYIFSVEKVVGVFVSCYAFFSTSCFIVFEVSLWWPVGVRFFHMEVFLQLLIILFKKKKVLNPICRCLWFCWQRACPTHCSVVEMMNCSSTMWWWHPRSCTLRIPSFKSIENIYRKAVVCGLMYFSSLKPCLLWMPWQNSCWFWWSWDFTSRPLTWLQASLK